MPLTFETLTGSQRHFVNLSSAIIKRVNQNRPPGVAPGSPVGFGLQTQSRGLHLATLFVSDLQWLIAGYTQGGKLLI